MSTMRIWIVSTTILSVLALITLTSITTGPSADDAIAAIRVAQREVFEAKRVYQKSAPSALKNPEAALKLASEALQEKRYEEAILAARQASRLVRMLGGQDSLGAFGKFLPHCSSLSLAS
ncbi:MAG: hypothetical protein HYU46_07535 [Deltaproteobacteria bacterium]|nr:hypothetical protein [Deltaproteobacteria bacterium]